MTPHPVATPKREHAKADRLEHARTARIGTRLGLYVCMNPEAKTVCRNGETDHEAPDGFVRHPCSEHVHFLGERDAT